MYDSKTKIDEFLNAAAAKQPTPGGGSVSALVGALAASMGEMVINYSIGKKGLEAFTDELKPALAELTKARQLLLQLMVEDQAAYEAMTAARKLPADHPDKKSQTDTALLACIRVPESMAATGIAILQIVDQIVSFVNPWLLSDLAVCSDLAMATTRCAVHSVRANISSLEDAGDRAALQAQTTQTLAKAAGLIQQVAPRIWQRVAEQST